MSRKRPPLFKSDQWYFHQDNTSVHNSIFFTDYLTKLGTKTVPQPPYSSDLYPCDFWLFHKLRGCRYDTMEEMKEAMTRSLTRDTQVDFHGAFQKLLERYNKCIEARGDYFEGDKSFMCVLSIKVPIRKKWGNLSYAPRISPSPSCLIVFFFKVLWQALRNHLFFSLLWFFPFVVFRDREVHNTASSVFFCWCSLNLVFWVGFGDLNVSQNPKEFYASHSPGGFWVVHLTFNDQISISCPFLCGSPSPLSRV